MIAGSAAEQILTILERHAGRTQPPKRLHQLGMNLKDVGEALGAGC